MNARQELQLRSIDEVVIVLMPIPDSVAALAEVRRGRDRLKALAARIRDIYSRQVIAERERLGSTDFARRTMRTLHLIPISRRAKRLFRDEPSVLKALRVPPARATADEHVAAALAMVKALSPHQKFLRSEGFHRGFLTDLKEGAKKMQADAKRSERGRRELTATTRELRHASVRRARRSAFWTLSSSRSFTPAG